jgi:hypothetical protein
VKGFRLLQGEACLAALSTGNLQAEAGPKLENRKNLAWRNGTLAVVKVF